jgi:hypothetical protein
MNGRKLTKEIYCLELTTYLNGEKNTWYGGPCMTEKTAKRYLKEIKEDHIRHHLLESRGAKGYARYKAEYKIHKAAIEWKEFDSVTVNPEDNE